MHVDCSCSLSVIIVPDPVDTTQVSSVLMEVLTESIPMRVYHAEKYREIWNRLRMVDSSQQIVQQRNQIVYGAPVNTPHDSSGLPQTSQVSHVPNSLELRIRTVNEAAIDAYLTQMRNR